VLLFFFNPIVDSMRALQQASALKSVQKKLGVPRASLGSFSEARQVFDPELLRPIIGELAKQAQPLARDSRLTDLKQLLTLVDGTLLTALPRMAEASLLKRQTGSGQVKWCLHTHFDVEKYVPDRIDVTPDAGGDRPDHPVRLVIVKVTPHERRGKYRGGSSGVDSDGFLRIMTNLLEVPAEIIALIYQYRWQIEPRLRTVI